jgi:chromosome segregation ATPase
MKVRRQVSKIFTVSSAARWYVLACVGAWLSVSGVNLLCAEENSSPVSSQTNEIQNVSTQSSAGDDMTRLSLAELKSKLAGLEQQAKQDPGAARQRIEFIKKLREDIQARLDKIDRKISEIASQNKKIIADWRERRQQVDKRSQSLEASDESARKLRDRIADLEKELAQTRQELQKKLEAMPEMKEMMDGQNAASDELKKLTSERQGLLAERKDLVPKRDFLTSLEGAAGQPPQQGGDTGNK